MLMRGKMLMMWSGVMTGVMFLVPQVPSGAQQPAGGEAPRVERGGGQQDPFSAVERMQQDIKRMQRDLERARQELDARMRDLQRRQQQFNGIAGQPNGLAAPPSATRRSASGDVAQAPSAVPGTQPSATPPPAPGADRGGIPAHPEGTPGDFDRRLQDVERKLDMLIKLMRQNQRSGVRSSTNTAPGIPREANPDRPAPGTAVPAAGYSPVTPEVPVPPAPSAAPARRSLDVAPARPETRVGF